ncbi:MAG TPA: hypothetical protein VFN31_02260 [Candidatus Saccharimonadales bacterium]|nr:hypothetical protein [Candidatus Saccharimonadales bacterium]
MARLAIKALSLLSSALILLPVITINQASADYCYSYGNGSCSSPTTALFGQSQSYDVILRGDGSAAVNARISLYNDKSKPINLLSYSLASGQLQGVTAYQQVTCATLPIIRPNLSSTVLNSEPNPTLHFETSTNIPECYEGLVEHPLNSKFPLAYYYPSSYDVFKSIVVTKLGNTFNLKLPQPIANNQSTTIVMLYNETGVSHKSLGIHYYSFKTLKSSEAITDINVALSAPSDYVLSNAGHSTNDNPITTSNALSTILQVGNSPPSNESVYADVNNYVNSIGGNGSITRQTTLLSPQQTFSLTGRFAASAFLLNWPRNVSLWALVLAFIGVLIYWYISNRKKIKEQLNMVQTNSTGTNGDSEYKQELDNEDTTIENDRPGAISSSDNRKTVSITVRALPFYDLAIRVKQHFQQRRLRPMFFALLCGIVSILVVAGLAQGYSEATKISNNAAINGNATPAIVIGLYIGLIAIGIMSFMVFSIGLPILYAGSFRRALRIFIYLIIFFMIMFSVAVFIGLKQTKTNANNQNYCTTYYGCCSSGTVGNGLCYGT